MNTFIL